MSQAVSVYSLENIFRMIKSDDEMRDLRNVCISRGTTYRLVETFKVWQTNIICSTVVV